MSALKIAGVTVGAVAGTLVVVNLVQSYRRKKALKQFEKAVEGMAADLEKMFSTSEAEFRSSFSGL